MKYFLRFLLVFILCSIAFSEQFPVGSIEKVEIPGLGGPMCVVQNPIDSLIYAVSVNQNTARSTIFVLDNEMHLVDSIKTDNLGDSISTIYCGTNDSSGKLAFGGYQAIYLVEVLL